MKAVLLSGGIDSSAVACLAKPDIAITIDYGQIVARAEIQAARAICSDLDIAHKVLRIDCSPLARGALGGLSPSPLSKQPDWWPYRNQLLVSFAAGFLIDTTPLEILIGTVRGDGRAHRDGTKQFLSRMNTLLRCQEGEVILTAPAIDLTSEEILKQSQLSESTLGWTFSCNQSEYPCGNCRGCLKRVRVLRACSSQLI